MKTLIVIPANNEEIFLKSCLDSIVEQTLTPDELIIVDDNSTDTTFQIAEDYSKKHEWIKVFRKTSSEKHIPGKKVVDTFNYGLSQANQKYDLVGKFDADIILPKNYITQIQQHFNTNPNLGMCSGLLYIKVKDDWQYEPIADKSHVRGPIKMYSKECFRRIGGLRPSIGWDTVDELLALYYGFDIHTDQSLSVKHLRPTGASYTKKSKLLQGEAIYRMRYGFLLGCIASTKMALKQRKIIVFINNMKGYFNANHRNLSFIVSKEEGRFIRKFRWLKIRKKLF